MAAVLVLFLALTALNTFPGRRQAQSTCVVFGKATLAQVSVVVLKHKTIWLRRNPGKKRTGAGGGMNFHSKSSQNTVNTSVSDTGRTEAQVKSKLLMLMLR